MKKKILISSVHMGIGGIESVLVNFLNHIDYSKYDVDLVLYKKIGLNLEKIPKCVSIYSIFSFNNKSNLDILTKKDSFFSKVIRRLAFLENNIKKYVSSKEYDVGIAFSGYHVVMDSFIAYSNCKCKYIWVHTDYKYLSLNNSSFIEKIPKYKKIYELFDKVVTVSQSTKLQFVEVFKECVNKTEYIWNLFPESFPKDKITLSKKYNIVSIGRIVHQKGYDRLCDIVKLLIKSRKDFHIYIIGDGEEKNTIEKRIKELSLDKYITMTGSKSKVYEYLNSADLYLSTSYYEGLATVLIEALVCNVPIVGPKVVGVYDIHDEIAPKNTFILTKNNNEAIKDGILEAMNSHINRKFKFNANKFNEITLKKYNKVLEGEL